MASLENAVKSMATALSALEAKIAFHQGELAHLEELEMIARAQLTAAHTYSKNASHEITHIKSELKILEARLNAPQNKTDGNP